MDVRRKAFITLAMLLLIWTAQLPHSGRVGRADSPLRPGEGSKSNGIFSPVRDIFNKGNPFLPPSVHLVKIILDPESEQKLREQSHMNAPRYDVPCTFIFDNETYKNVAIHLRGRMGSFRPFDDKPGFRLDFNKFDKNQRFHGLQELSLHNSVQDPSYMTEYIGYAIWRAAGIPAPEVTWARVFVNGRYVGLYYIKEVINKDFIKRWFKDYSGNLYKATLGKGINDFNNPFGWELQTNKSKNDRSDLENVARAIEESKDEKSGIMGKIGTYIDLYNYATNWALEDITFHWDGYIQSPWNNNFYVYHDPESGRFFIFPHGADQLFQNVEAGFLQVRSPVASRLLRDKDFEKYLQMRRKEIVWKLLGPNANNIANHIEQIRRLLIRYIPQWEMEAFESRIRYIKGFIRFRMSALSPLLE
jgi:hypothetical protein